uniref:Large ribosomal subunit protein uL6c n=1 Tax=Caloglossa intermedia TaxID=100879 RepID=A0A1Z1M672_9FLOR|nr:ribosomal protein L6 [Caloglossa intermedia]ARW61506.1 ribosomal protein L6 [Caloglossa intermedia]
MSRIGKKEIIIPDSVNIKISEPRITAKGPRGELSCLIPDFIDVKHIDNKLKLKPVSSSEKKIQALHGLYRSLINNMIIGVSQGFEKKLVISGVGYRSYLENSRLILNLGYSHPVYIDPPKEISIKIENNTNISVNGIDKQLVGETAAKIRSMRPPEPYKGKGIRYVNENIKRKIGKAGK